MASAFNLTAQLNLRGPTNIRPIVSQIRRELGSIKADVNLNIDSGSVRIIDNLRGRFDALNASIAVSKANVRDLTVLFRDLSSSLSSAQNLNIGGTKGLASTAADAQKATKTIKESTTAIEDFGKKSALAFKRFAAFTVVTSGIYAIVNAVNSGVQAFIEFERQIIRLRQVTDAGAVGIGLLEKEISNLAQSLGVSSASLIEVSTTLAQAGLNADETRIALSALAKTELAPSFDNLTQTTEGAIAALRQFGLQASDLEAVLGSINAVAAKFAVESNDIIAAIQRTGGVFASASRGVTEGKDALNEFIAVFTSVRATTRESAETIATGLRTIFTRIQRAGTIQQLKEFGVELQDLEGKFVGPFEAIRRLSEALTQLDPRDIRFATIVEELGGFRQIGKVIPLIQQFATAQEALKVAQQGSGSLSEAQALAQQSLANQIARVREEFLALIRDVGKSTTFQVITKTVLTLTSGLIKLAGAFKPILPILGILGAVKGISAISQFASGFFGLAGKGGGGPDAGGDTIAQAERDRAEATNRASDIIRENTTALSALTSAIQSLENSIQGGGSATLNQGGRVLAFAKGGYVPGTGNRDTVPAMLQPGEFVIRKKAVEKIGAGKLQQMNKYAYGGKVKDLATYYSSISKKEGFDEIANQNIKDNSVFKKVKPTDLKAEQISEWRGSDLPRWKKFEYVLSENYGLGPPASEKFALLDFPRSRSEAKFMNKGDTYDDPDSIKGNNEATIAAKNFLYENSLISGIENLRPDALKTRAIANKPVTTYWADPQEFINQGLNKGGMVQAFAQGGQAESYYGQAEVEAARAAVEEYKKSIAEAFSLENIYFEILEGKSIADGIDPEVYGTGIGKLAKGQPGVIGSKKISFTKAETADNTAIPDTKALKAAALSARQAQLQAYTDAEDSIAAFKKSGVLTNISPDITSYIQNTIANLDNSTLDPDIIDSVRKKLTKPNLGALEGLFGSQKRVEVQGQRTKLAEVFNAILETYRSDVSVKEIDSISAALGKKLFGGGLISKFIDGGIAQTPDSSELIRSVEELGGPQTVRGLLGADRINAAIKQISAQTTSTTPTAKQLFSKTFLDSKNSGPYLGMASELLKEAKLAVKKPRVFSEEEKANATKLAVVGMTPFDLSETKFEELAGRIVSLNLATLRSDKAPAVLEMKQEIDKALNKFATSLGGQDLAELDDTTKEAMGLGNLEGYMIEAVLAKLGANPGKLDDRSVDYAQGLGRAASLFGIEPNIPTEVKRDVRSGLGKARENFTNYFKKFAFGGRADGPSFEDVRQQIIDKYPEIEFRITKRKPGRGFGYNLMGALKAQGGLSGDSSLNFQQPSNLKQLTEFSDKLADKLINPQKLADGGSVEDTVPALLTPGEFVINKKAAQKIGYGQLKKLNHADKMQGYNKGGIVGGIQAFREGGIATPNERAAGNIGNIIKALSVSGSGTPEAIEKLEDIVANLLNEVVSSKDGIYQTAQIIRELRSNTDKSDSDQLGTLNNIIEAIKNTGDFQAATAEKQAQAIERFLANRDKATTVVGQFPPPDDASPIPSKEDVLAEVEKDRTNALENIAQAAFAAGKGLEEFITDLEDFYKTVEKNQLEKMQETEQGPLTLSQTRQAAVTATATTEQAFGVNFGEFVVNDFKNLSTAIKEEIDARKESARVAAEAAAEAKKAAEKYKNSGDAFRDFGTLGTAFPAQAKAFKETRIGGALLSGAQRIQEGPKAIKGLSTALERLPGPLGGAVRAIGGLPGVAALAATAIGSELMPALGDLFNVASSPTFAGVSGALAEGGSMALSIGTLGQQLAGPIGGLIGTIGGAVSGAISGFFKGLRTQTLANSLNDLNKNALAANRALEKLSKTDTAENANKASLAVGRLQSNISDLGGQASRTGSERAQDAAGGAAAGATYGALAAAALAISGVVTGGLSIAAVAGIVALGAAIGGIKEAIAGPTELDSEALKSQLQAVEQYIEGINQLGQRRLKTRTLEEVEQFLTDLENARTPEQRAAVGARTVRVEEAQRAQLQLQGFNIEDTQGVNEFINDLSGSAQRNAKATAEAARRNYLYALGMDEINKQYKGNEKAIREASRNEEDVIALGAKRNLMLGEQEAKERKLALAMKQVEQRLANMTDIFKRINAGIKRFADESDQYIKDVESSVSGLLGDGQLRDVNRENERILANPLAYSEQEVRRAGMAAEGLAGGGPEGAQIGNMALASKLIEENLPAILRGTEKGNIEPALDAIKGFFEQAGFDPQSGAFQDVFKQIENSLANAAAGGEGVTLGDLSIADELIPQISKILEQGREVALNIQKEYNDTIQRTIDLQNKANALLARANEYERQAQQIRLNADVQLAEKIGDNLTLDQLNKPFETNIRNLTEGLIDGGSTDPEAIGNAIIESNRRIADRQKALDQNRAAVGIVGAADPARAAAMTEANNAEQKAIAEEIRKTNEATKALETLANSGELAANALKVFDQMQQKTTGFTNFIDKLITGSPEEIFKVQQQQSALNSFLSGNVSPQMMRNPEMRQLISGGMADLQGVLDPQDYRRMQAQFRRESLVAAGVDLNQQTNIKDAKGNNLTIDQLLSRAENPEDTPEAKAFKAAAEAQAQAAEKMAEINRIAAEEYITASDNLIAFFNQEFPDIVKKAYDQVRTIEASARETTAEKPEQTPQPQTATQQALSEAEARVDETGSRYRRARASRREAESSWFETTSGRNMARGLEQNAREEYNAAIIERDRLKAEAQKEKEMADAQAQEARKQSEAKKQEELDRQRQSAAQSQPPSSRLPAQQLPQIGVNQQALPLPPNQTALPQQVAQNQTAAADQLNQSATNLNQATSNLNNATSIGVSGGAMATPNNVANNTAMTVTISNLEEIQQSLVVRLDDTVQATLVEFSNSLSQSFREFGNYITRLEKIKLPDKIEMTGRHTVDVRITGAAAFDSLEDSFRDLVQSEIRKKMEDLWRQSDGNYGERPA